MHFPDKLATNVYNFFRDTPKEVIPGRVLDLYKFFKP
jgi:hypothetical protein